VNLFGGIIMSKPVQDFLGKIYENERLEETKKKFVNECVGSKGPIVAKVEDIEEQGIVQSVLTKLQPLISKASTAAGTLGMGKEFPGEVASGMHAIQSGRLSRPWGMPEEEHNKIMAGESKQVTGLSKGKKTALVGAGLGAAAGLGALGTYIATHPGTTHTSVSVHGPTYESKIEEQETPAEKANELQPVPEGDIDDILDDFEDEVLGEQNTPPIQFRMPRPETYGVTDRSMLAAPRGTITMVPGVPLRAVGPTFTPPPPLAQDTYQKPVINIPEQPPVTEQKETDDVDKELEEQFLKKVAQVAAPLALGAVGYGLGTGAIQQALPGITQGLGQAGSAAMGAAKDIGSGVSNLVSPSAPAPTPAAPAPTPSPPPTPASGAGELAGAPPPPPPKPEPVKSTTASSGHGEVAGHEAGQKPVPPQPHQPVTHGRTAHGAPIARGKIGL
jgi:hypothetical protein